MNVALDRPQDAPSLEALERHISAASEALRARQHEDGHWCFELEADVTIPAEYVLLRHFRGEEPNLELERLIAIYIRRIQGDHGGWPLFHAGAFDMSASVKAYFALKMIGDDPQAPHMRRAREAILARGGAARSNVFTRASARALRRHPLERRSDHAGRDHASSALVSLPSRQDFLLGAHGARSAHGAAGPEAATRQSARRRDRGTLRGAAGDRARLADGRASDMGVDKVLRRDRQGAQARRTPLPAINASPRHRRRRDFRDRAAQRRGRARGNLSRHGERRADVRRARLSSRPSHISLSRAGRSSGCSSSARTKPIASLACRRSGIRRSQSIRCWKRATRRAPRRRGPDSNG